MAKEAYYFSHDSNARQDPKCAALINDFGFVGYGLYWAIIEILHEQRNGKIEKFPKLYEGLAYQLKTTKEEIMKQIEAMLKDYYLLQEDEKYIWSDRVLRNLEQRKEKYLIKAEAGRIGGIKSGIARKTKERQSKTKQNEALLEANEQKESKVKESKVKESKEKKIINTHIPEFSEFSEYARTLSIYHRSLDFQIQAKYRSWVENQWRDGNDKKIKSWKTKLQNTMPYMKKDLTPEPEYLKD